MVLLFGFRRIPERIPELSGAQFSQVLLELNVYFHAVEVARRRLRVALTRIVFLLIPPSDLSNADHWSSLKLRNSWLLHKKLLAVIQQLLSKYFIAGKSEKARTDLSTLVPFLLILLRLSTCR